METSDSPGGVTIVSPDSLRPPARTWHRLGVPNRGRLFGHVAALIERAYDVDIRGRGMVFRVDDGFEIVCARSADLPALLSAGLVDVAITGHDYVVDSGLALDDVVDLDLIAGQVGVLIPAEARWAPDEIETIVSQYPRLASRWWEAQGRTARVLAVSGASEVYPQISAVEAVIDVVASGETAESNGLRAVEWITPTSGRVFLRADEQEPAIRAIAARLQRHADHLPVASGRA
jgi:ATP phosphoribosyltransferase